MRTRRLHSEYYQFWFDAAAGYRFTPNIQMKLQYGIQQEDYSSEAFEHTFGA